MLCYCRTWSLSDFTKNNSNYPGQAFLQFCQQEHFLPTIFLDPNYFYLNLLGTNISGPIRLTLFISNLNPQTKMHLKMEFDSGVAPTCFVFTLDSKILRLAFSVLRHMAILHISIYIYPG